MRRLTLLPLALLGLLLGCQGGGSSNSQNATPTREGRGEPFLDKNAPAQKFRIQNARIVLYQPRTNATLILVDNRNAKLKTRKGRLELAMGNPRLGFKRVSPRLFDALLQSFENRDAGEIQEDFTPRHAAMLKAKKGQIPRLHGIIMVENGGQRYALVGWRPQGREDKTGIRRYQIFRDLKLLIANAYNAEGFVEYVDQAGLGASGTSFDQ
ncbi:MAG TPA: hypothetical protein ENK43_13400 [Planctomycetes bacterium]|nr:hypothetical protein [Planctomycetota bacterium]